jgi:hypothetical protein
VVDFLCKNYEEEELSLFAGIARRIWVRRNELVHEGKFLHPNKLLQQAQKSLVEFMEANVKLQHPLSNDEGTHKWTTPALGHVKLNWDTAICS